jgi:DNA-binding NarL/FixJ family response regulator
MACKVLLVDDHAIVREGLCRLLKDSPGISVVGQAADGHEALRLAKKHAPDVVVLDLSMPGLDGMAVTKQLAQECPATRVVILTMHCNEHYAIRLLQAGAHGFLGKGACGDELLKAIYKVASGGRYLPVHLADAIPLIYARKKPALAPLESLSDRELQVLKFVAEGFTGSEIGKQLNLSVKTVDTYRARLLVKLELQSTADLIRFALRHGVIDSPW